MIHRRFLITACVGALLIALPTFSQVNFPDHLIKIVIPFPPGGPTDAIGRVFAREVSRALGQPVIVDNKAGAGGLTGSADVARAPADGYTLLMNPSVQVTWPSLIKQLRFDPIHDFRPVAMLGLVPLVAVVPASGPHRSVRDIVDAAKEKPGKLTYASPGVGSFMHLTGEFINNTAGIQTTHVPYKGSGPAVQDVLAGQVQVFITTPPSVMQHVQSGKLKALAVTGKTRHPGMPNVPTTAEAGLPTFQLESWVALYAPAGTPAPVITKLTDSVKASLALPEVKERADTAGVELRYLTPAATDALLKKELPFWNKAIKSAHITLD